MAKKFQRTIEDFVCENCGTSVKGNGYTNHCPNCLWSKHVDVNPGDRANSCHGMMKPIEAFYKGGQWHLKHRCVKCGGEMFIRLDEKDNLAKVGDLVEDNIKSLG